MNIGVAILLKRMDSHPEEFQGLGYGIKVTITERGEVSRRWDAFISAALKSTFLTGEERELLLNKLSSIQGNAFSAAVVEELTSNLASGTAEWVSVPVGGQKQ
jgi:hypothetical protein